MPPFQSNDGSQEALFDAILNGFYEIPGDISISKTAVHFMSQLIKLEDVLRMSSEDALKHPWINGARNLRNVVNRNENFEENANNVENYDISVNDLNNETNGSSSNVQVRVENLIDFGDENEENENNNVNNLNLVPSLPNSSELTLSNFSSEGILEQEVPISNGFQSNEDDYLF